MLVGEIETSREWCRAEGAGEVWVVYWLERVACHGLREASNLSRSSKVEKVRR